ncbi:LysR family transcriptional regulator ArgP [Dietzia aurantiaca]|uniref:LysR family transcriptional regulator ArgP n=1 Tax=Dietzia aurantiaca TaxID=983873 RepID=UPI001E2A156B|nr:LysR family transcriptional regulator ArgP [Dietzia aurantiaca]MCD2262927.1 LysR family transcriptional regulator ArgP [Dietzia aurantiaca]
MATLQLDQLRTLAAVVDLGSFEAAAAHLHITQSAVSQRIRAMEESAGRILVRRERPITATESGEVVLRTARQMLHLEESLAGELGDSATSQDHVALAVACNSDSLATWFLDAMTEVHSAGRVVFDIRREDESLSSELLRRGEVMAAVTSESRPVQGCRSLPLGSMRYLACASPGFVARHLRDGSPTAALGRAPIVDFDRSDAHQNHYYRRLTRRQPTGPRHYIPSSHDHVRAIVAGLGWGLIPEQLATPWLVSGEIENVSPDRPLDVPLFWQHWKLQSPDLDALTDAVLDIARAELRT